MRRGSQFLGGGEMRLGEKQKEKERRVISWK